MTLTTVTMVVIFCSIALVFCQFELMQKAEAREQQWRAWLIERLNELEKQGSESLERYHDERVLPTIELLVAQKVRAMPPVPLPPIPEPQAPIKQPQKKVDDNVRIALEDQLRRSY